MMRFHRSLGSLGAVPPQAFSIEDQKKWMDLTVAYGDPVFKDPFWFWPGYKDKADATQVQVECRPFKTGVTGQDISACAVWNDKLPGDVLWEIAPPYMEDHSGGATSQDPKYQPPLTTDEKIREVEKQNEEQQKTSSFNWTTWLVFAMVGVGAYFGFRKRKR